jgi:hypothetical protein
MPPVYRSEAGLHDVREEVLRRAAEFGGPFRRSDLARWGIDGAVLQPMMRRRWWVRLHHGVYVDARAIDGQTDPSHRHRVLCAASIRALAGEAYAFGSSAAVLHDLPIEKGILSEVQLVRPLDLDGRAFRRRITSSTSLSPARIRAHHLRAGDTETVGGVPTVTRPLAAVTTAAMSSKRWAVATLDSAAWQSPALLPVLADLAEDWSHLRGIGVVRAALPLVRAGAQTPLETFSRLVLVDCGLPEPRLQVALHDADGLIGVVDMLWDDLNVVGEADGLVKYDSRDVLIREKEREDRIRALGFGVVRWTWRQLFEAPDAIARRITTSGQPLRRAI